jgi:hypothetical protein
MTVKSITHEWWYFVYLSLVGFELLATLKDAGYHEWWQWQKGAEAVVAFLTADGRVSQD